jgi:hypothetical protein
MRIFTFFISWISLVLGLFHLEQRISVQLGLSLLAQCFPQSTSGLISFFEVFFLAIT